MQHFSEAVAGQPHIRPVGQDFRPQGNRAGPRRGTRLSAWQSTGDYPVPGENAGLEITCNPYDVLLLIKRAGRTAGFTSRMISLLEYYLAFTRQIDWEEGSRPIVYQSLTHTALDLAVSERQIQLLEKKLHEAGVLTWHDSGNRRRYGQRCTQTGRIAYAFGVDLSPLAGKTGQFKALLAAKQEREQAWKDMKRQVSWYRGQIRIFRDVLGTSEAEDEGALSPQEASLLGVQIRAGLSLEKLATLREQHKGLFLMLRERAGAIGHAEQEAGDIAAVKAEKTAKDSRLGEKNVTPIKDTNNHSFDESNIRACDEALSGQGGHEAQSPMRSREQTRTDGVSVRPQSKHGQLESERRGMAEQTGLQHVTWQMILDAASVRMQAYLPLKSGDPDWKDIVQAAYRLREDLGISQALWARACQWLGKGGAVVCVLLADQAAHRTERPARNSGGYFNGLLERARRGELHLHYSVFAMVKRGAGTA